MTQTKLPALRAFLFDLDGTLIDSKLDLVNSVNFMLEQTGRSVLPVDTVASYVGHGAPRLIASVLGASASDEDRANGLRIFLDHYGKHNVAVTRPYPGVVEALEQLRHLPLAVLTNKPLQMSLEILDALDLRRFFRAVYGGDSFETKKPHPEGALSILRELGAEPGCSAMVGDSDVDIQTARNANMPGIGVTYGFGQHDRAALPADIYVDSLVEIVPFAAGASGAPDAASNHG